MSTHNIKFHDKKIILEYFFWSYRKDCVGTQKRIRISHGKRAIGVRAIEVRLKYRRCPGRATIKEHSPPMTAIGRANKT